jgi:hypothetical protein
MVIQDFASKPVFPDIAPLIYFIKGHSTYQAILANLFDFNDKGCFSFATFSVTLLEVLSADVTIFITTVPYLQHLLKL